jgi:hypothetical protein
VKAFSLEAEMLIFLHRFGFDRRPGEIQEMLEVKAAGTIDVILKVGLAEDEGGGDGHVNS